MSIILLSEWIKKQPNYLELQEAFDRIVKKNPTIKFQKVEEETGLPTDDEDDEY